MGEGGREGGFPGVGLPGGVCLFGGGGRDGILEAEQEREGGVEARVMKGLLRHVMEAKEGGGGGGGGGKGWGKKGGSSV